MKLFVPRPYQDIIIDHITQHPRCAVWAGMGLGKTISTLTALDVIQMATADAYPALVLGPLRVARKVWREEVGKWQHMKDVGVVQIIGTAAERKAALAPLLAGKSHAQVYAINYDVLPWLADQLADAKRVPFRTIIPDESRRLKAMRLTQGGAQTRALARFAWNKNVKHFIELTGTPAPNGLKDMWGQLWFLDRGKRLGQSYSDFDQRWFAYKRIKDAINPSKSFIQTVILPGADKEIHALVNDLCLGIDAADWFDLDKPIVTTVRVELPEEAQRLYRQMERDFFISLEEHAIEAVSAGAKSVKLLQLANGAAYLDPDVFNEADPRARAYIEVHDAKIEALHSIVEEAEGMPLIVVYNFQSDIPRLLKAFPSARVLHSEKDEDDFKAGLIPMLLAHPKSAGHGIDGFQLVTNIMVFFGHSWDLELRLQIIARIGPERQMSSGMNRPVFVYDIIAEDTIDEDVRARHETKRSVQDLLMDAAKRRHGITL